jgi:FlaA1/EpsC-like NDP-sugar epimerase
MSYLRNRHFLIIDCVLLPLAAYLSYVLRLDTFQPQAYARSCALLILLTLLLMPPVFRGVGVYSHYWRYASVEELMLLGGATAAGVLLVTSSHLVVARAIWNVERLPVSIPIIFFFLALAAAVMPRLVARLAGRSEHRLWHTYDGQAVVVFGAGEAGAMVVRELRRNPQLGMRVVAFLDDDPLKCRLRIHGVPVLGNRHKLARVVQQCGASQVILALPTVPGKVIRELVVICEEAGARPLVVPGLYAFLGGSLHVDRIRSVEIEDLLRREPIPTELEAIGDLLRGRRVLVTGAGGSIGSELCRQLLRCAPSEIVLLGHGENSVFDIHSELLRALQLPAVEQAAGGARIGLRPVIADIRDSERIQSVFETYRPEFVFHAAAHKHVPLMEMNQVEAITNNVMGTRNVLDAAQKVGVERFVLVSTDKAVHPSSIMGATKRIAELLTHQAAEKTGKAYMVVRFGNVLGSRGSVVLTMKQQIRLGVPVTVTHPDMKRYFMTIPEAVQLLLQACILGSGGEVFVFDMGEPVKILDLARDLIRLSGLEIGQDIDIAFTGIRPGEKLYEELFIAGESYERTRHKKVFVASNAGRLLPANLDQALVALQWAVERRDEAAIVLELQRLIPEYQAGTDVGGGKGVAASALPATVAAGATGSTQRNGTYYQSAATVPHALNPQAGGMLTT